MEKRKDKNENERKRKKKKFTKFFLKIVWYLMNDSSFVYVVLQCGPNILWEIFLLLADEERIQPGAVLIDYL